MLGFLVAMGSVGEMVARSRKTSSTHPPGRGTVPSAAPQAELTGLTFEELTEWVRDDREIEVPADDRFGHDAIARRIVRRLEPGDRDAPLPSIAVVGPRGSGKSSLGNLVRWHLKQRGLLGRSILFVPVSLWPFQSSTAAVRGILQTLTDALAPYADTAGLSEVPAHYAEAVSSSGGWISILGSLLSPGRNPDRTLDRLAKIVRALDLRIILWIDDLERFTGAVTDGSSAGTGSGEERLGPIRSPLHMLDRKDRITVIVAAETLDAGFDMDKLARFIEPMPTLDPGDTATVFDRFRRGCLDEFGEWIDACQERPDRLLDALEQAPSVIVPQIVPFLTRGNGRRWVFDGAVARSLFDMDRLGELLRRRPIPDPACPDGLASGTRPSCGRSSWMMTECRPPLRPATGYSTARRASRPGRTRSGCGGVRPRGGALVVTVEGYRSVEGVPAFAARGDAAARRRWEREGRAEPGADG